MVLTDAAMATIFKLLRIQYALSHQDERDKQNIFLAGFSEVGQAQQQAEKPADELTAASVQDETASASAREADSKADGQGVQAFQSIEISGTDPSHHEQREPNKAFDSTIDSKGSNI